jgi:hypothetical protein
MGISLVGLVPKDTYQSLIKTTDNTACSTVLKTISDGSGNDTVLQLSTLRVGVIADSTVTTQTSSVIQATTTNANLVLAPNGTGALIAQIPDGTATGGNARGANAVDLQIAKYNNAQVASGANSFLGGGSSNRASGATSVCVGGENNFSTGQRSFVGSGVLVTASGLDSVCVGGNGNNALSNYSVVSGGQSNTASTGTHATVVGGLSNTATGQYSVAGGNANTPSGTWNVALGRSNTTSPQHATAFGYNNNISGEAGFAAGRDHIIIGQRAAAVGNNQYLVGYASFGCGELNETTSVAQFSSVIGAASKGYLYGQFVSSNGTDLGEGTGRSQQSILVARRISVSLTTGGTTVLSLDGTGVTNLLIPSGNNRAWNVQVNWVAVVTAITGTATGISVGDVVTSVDLLGFKRVGGTSSASAHTSAATKLMVTTPAAYAACAIAYSAGASQEMAMTFTGPTFAGAGSVTMRVVARIELTEVAF